MSPDSTSSKSADRERWLSDLEKLVSRFPERRKSFETDSHIVIKTLYEQSADPRTEQTDYPGQYPFTRGIQPNMFRGKLWTMRQYAGFGSAEESNRRYHYLLSQGTTGLSVAFDLPTQMGYDSDHPMARGEVGRVGVAISILDDMLELFDGIPLDKVSTSMTINSTAAILMAFYIAAAKHRKIPLKSLSGTVQNDILKEYIARGTYIYPPRESMRLVTDIMSFCQDQLPQWNTISISGYHIREAGANAVQELAFTFANAIAYVKAAVDSGLKVDDVAPRIAFFWGCHNNFFEEIAKFRASRRIWAKIMKEQFGAKSSRSCMLRFHTQTAGCTLTAQQPENNAARVTVQAMAAVLGGTQSLHTNALDEALGLPTQSTARVALRTQQILAHESGIADTVDPMGGSFFVESLTDEIESQVWEYLNKIDRDGGAIPAIESGLFQHEIAAESYRYQTEIESKDRIIVGVNAFIEDDLQEPPVLKIDSAVEEKRREKLRKLRQDRDNTRVSSALSHLTESAKGKKNLLPEIIHAVEQRATLGEISDALRLAWGEYQGSE